LQQHEGLAMAAENAIPTIDVSPLRGSDVAAQRDVARQIDAACTDTGFFLVVGHGIA
jgi:isopenicillin-N synthase